MLVRKTININEDLTPEQIAMLEQAAKMPIMFDEDSPEFSDEELKEFRRVKQVQTNERRKQNVTLRLSPQTIRKAKTLGKGYSSVLSRILEDAINDTELIKRYL